MDLVSIDPLSRIGMGVLWLMEHSERTSLGLDLKNIISYEKKIFLLVKLCFSLHFFSDFIPLNPDPDPDPRTQMNPDPHHWICDNSL